MDGIRFFKPRRIHLIEMMEVDENLGSLVYPVITTTNERKARSYVRAQNRIAVAEGAARRYSYKTLRVM